MATSVGAGCGEEHKSVVRLQVALGFVVAEQLIVVVWLALFGLECHAALGLRTIVEPMLALFYLNNYCYYYVQDCHVIENTEQPGYHNCYWVY